LIVALVPIAIACSDGVAPTPPPAATPTSPARFITIAPATIHVVSNLSGGNVTVTAFNHSDAITGYIMKGTTPIIFREHGAVQLFTPPAGFHPGNGFFFLEAGIDLAGNVASSIANDTAYRAFVWSTSGVTTLKTPTFPFIMPFGPRGCGANAISPHGYVVGNCNPALDFYIAEWKAGAIDTLKTSCCGAIDGDALAVSDNQYITGYISNFGPIQAFLWSPGQPSFTIIGIQGGKPQVSEGLAVNVKGNVAGWAIVDTLGADTAAILWKNRGVEILLSHFGQATGVDAQVNVVGWHRSGPGGAPTAFLWRPGIGLQNLPGLVAGGPSAAVAINDIHHILGWAIDGGGIKRTVIWKF
jgi:hypothetical protein